MADPSSDIAKIRSVKPSFVRLFFCRRLLHDVRTSIIESPDMNFLKVVDGWVDLPVILRELHTPSIRTNR
jgi:hypothetical protein